MAKIICPLCQARVPLPKRRRPLSGPGPGRAYDSLLCPSCDTDLGGQITGRQALRKKRKLGVFLKGAIACVILAFLCMAGGITVITMEPSPPWERPVELAFMVGAQVFLALGMLLKFATQLFEERPR